MDDDFFDRVKVSIRDEPIGRGPDGTAIREGRTAADLQRRAHRDPRMQVWRDDTLKRDFHSAAGFPIRNNGDVVGCFVLYSAEVDFFDAEEVKLLEEMTGDISFALKQMERDAERRRIEEEKNRVSAELQMLLDSVPAMIFHKDREHRLVRANAAMLRILGLPAGELIGKTDAELESPYHEQYARDEDEIAATGQPKLNFIEPLAGDAGQWGALAADGQGPAAR